jgi:hypothetical protein
MSIVAADADGRPGLIGGLADLERFTGVHLEYLSTGMVPGAAPVVLFCAVEKLTSEGV